ncbi:S-adenosyl-L-methionine-dependent methyltransferase [Cytidiella melzeri]|nr:S-adenosyl-L-methionine-dependent methyltransferase [Cytidiella melzeri]
MPSPADDIRLLLKLINSAAEDAIQQYESAGCDVPSIKSTTTPKLPQDSLPLKRSLRILEGACQQLVVTLTPPDIAVYTWTFAPGIDMACVRVIINANIPDLLALHPEGLSVQEIGNKTGLEPSKLLRVMRNLASKHCFREIDAGVFINNALSLALRSDQPVYSMAKLRANRLHEHAFGRLWDALSDPEYGHSNSVDKCAFAYGIKGEMPGGTLFTWLREHPEFSKLFNQGMGVLASVTNVPAVVKGNSQFPWNKLSPGSTFCDVGAGIGTMPLALVKYHDHIHYILQDTPNVIEHARKHWAQHNPVALENGNVSFAPMDFFTDAPLPGNDIYFLRQIIHDWTFENCVKILKNVRLSMKDGSRVLINEYILPPPTFDTATNEIIETKNVEGQSKVSQVAPKPLLPSYGAGSARTFLQDIAMLVLLNSQERTLEQIKEIGVAAGLRFIKHWDLLETGLVEFARDDDLSQAQWDHDA